MIHIKLPLGPVFGTAVITVLVTPASSHFEDSFFTLSVVVEGDLSHFILNFISSQPSHGIIHIFWFQSHCLVYVNV
jgi:6,7-dimethyl-8-ribityllumazine synthase